MKFLTAIFISLFSTLSWAGQLNLNVYSQNLYLSKVGNIISQNIIRGEWTWENKFIGQTYGGAYVDIDQLSNGKATYTDKQFSPLVGHQSPLLFNLPVRAFTELRQVNRLGDFPDNRAKYTHDWRTGLITYHFADFTSQFIETYGALFHTTLYEHEVIFQGWVKHGKRFDLYGDSLKFDVLHEMLFDLNRFVQPNNTYVDYKPGIRIGFFRPGFQLSVLQQYAISVARREGNRDPEWRTLLVYAQYF